MRDIGYYLYENVPLQTKYQWMAQAPGNAAVDPTRAMLGNTGNAYKASDGSVRDTLKALGIEWTGTAADAAGQALHRAADRSTAVGSASSTGSGSVAGYGQSFEAARAKVHWDDPGTWDWWEQPVDMIGLGLLAVTGEKNSIMSDHFRAVEHNRTLDAEATRALYEHESASRAALAAFPVVDPATAPTTDPAGAGGGAPRYGGAHVGAPHPGVPDVAGSQPGDPRYNGPQPTGPGGPVPTTPGANVNRPPQIDAAPDPLERNRAGATPNQPAAVAPGPQAPPPPNRTQSGTTPPANPPGPGGPPRVTSPQSYPPGPSADSVRSRLGRVPNVPQPDRPRPVAPAPSWRDTLPPIGTPPPVTARPPFSGDGGAGSRTGPGSTFRGSVGGGTEFADRMAPRSAEPTAAAAQTRGTGPAAGRATGSVPFMGGMGAGTGAGSTERKARYVIPTSEHFEVPLPMHPTGVIEAEE